LRSPPPLKPCPALTLKGGTPTRGLAAPDGGGSYLPTLLVNVSALADSLLDAHPPPTRAMPAHPRAIPIIGATTARLLLDPRMLIIE